MLRDQDILALEIPMGHIDRMQVLNALEHLVEPLLRQTLLKVPVLLDVVQEIALLSDAHENEDVEAALQNAVCLYDTRMVNFREDRYFPMEKTCQKLFRCFSLINYFTC